MASRKENATVTVTITSDAGGWGGGGSMYVGEGGWRFLFTLNYMLNEMFTLCSVLDIKTCYVI